MDKSKSSNKKTHSLTAENESTPVLVTITMANKNHLTTELNSLKSTKSAKSKSRRKSSSRKATSDKSPTKSLSTKDLLSRKNKNNFKSLNNDAAENCGTVELMKLTKSLSTYLNESELVNNPVASDCVTGACASSLNINNATDGDNDNNISSSSSSQQLLNPSEENSIKSEFCLLRIEV